MRRIQVSKPKKSTPTTPPIDRRTPSGRLLPY